MNKGSTAWKVSKCGVISCPYFPVFSQNTGKYGPEITPYLNTFQAVLLNLIYWSPIWTIIIIWQRILIKIKNKTKEKYQRNARGYLSEKQQNVKEFTEKQWKLLNIKPGFRNSFTVLTNRKIKP